MRLISANNGFWLKQHAIDAKSYIAQTLQRFFPTDQAALLSAIIIGTTNTLGADLKEQMNTSGTSYIVGMYGYKIALIGLFLSGLLKDFLPRKYLLLITLIAIALFIFISGASVSAIRAGIMGSLALLASALGRKFVARNALTFTAFIMALFDPRILAEPAFQLSFLSYVGIYHLGPPLKRLFYWNGHGFLEWKQHAMLSLSTNLAIVPVVMNTFGGFSLTSFISNILIMIPWALIIFFGLVIVAIGSLLPSLVFFLIPMVNLLLGYELFIIHLFASFVIPIPNVFTSTIAIIFYYGTLLIFIYYYGEAA
jgi:competence protein ComEC